MNVASRLGRILAALLFLACEPVEQDYAAYPGLDVSALPEAATPPLGPWAGQVYFEIGGGRGRLEQNTGRHCGSRCQL